MRLAQSVSDAQAARLAESQRIPPASPTLAKLMGLDAAQSRRSYSRAESVVSAGSTKQSNATSRKLARAKSTSASLFTREVSMGRTASVEPVDGEGSLFGNAQPAIKAKPRTSKRKQASPKRA